jgi:hypothetical protein
MSEITSPPFEGADFSYDRGFGRTAVFEIAPTRREQEKVDKFLVALKELSPLIESIKFRDDLTEGRLAAEKREKSARSAEARSKINAGKVALVADSQAGKFFYFTVWFQLPSGENRSAHFKFPAAFETFNAHFGDWLVEDVLTRRSFKYGTSLDFHGDGIYIGYDNGRVETEAQGLDTLNNFRKIFQKKFKYLSLGEAEASAQPSSE